MMQESHVDDDNEQSPLLSRAPIASRQRPIQRLVLAPSTGVAEIGYVNRASSPQYVAAGICTPTENLWVPDYAIAGYCTPLTANEYQSQSGLFLTSKPGCMTALYQRLMRNSKLEYYWYSHRLKILLSLMAAVIGSLALLFYLNPFQDKISQVSTDFAENFANLGEDPQQAVADFIDEGFTVVVYITVTLSVFTLITLLGWFVDLCIRPKQVFFSQFDSVHHADNVERGSYPTTIVTVDGHQHELVRVRGRWWVLRPPQIWQIRDSKYAELPAQRYPGREQLLAQLQIRARDGIAAARQAYALVYEAVQDCFNAPDHKTLLNAAKALAHALLKLKDSLSTIPEDDISDLDQNMLVAIRKLNRNEARDPVSAMSALGTLMAPAGSLAAQIEKLTQVVHESILEIAPIRVRQRVRSMPEHFVDPISGAVGARGAEANARHDELQSRLPVTDAADMELAGGSDEDNSDTDDTESSHDSYNSASNH